MSNLESASHKFDMWVGLKRVNSVSSSAHFGAFPGKLPEQS